MSFDTKTLHDFFYKHLRILDCTELLIFLDKIQYSSCLVVAPPIYEMSAAGENLLNMGYLK